MKSSEKKVGAYFEREEYQRYGRHFALPQIGLEGQRKLKQASVLVIGAGGLGSPVGLYLTAAGVGRIGLVDHDVVDLSNLQRQVLFSASMIGRSKLECARERLLELNPGVEITLHEESFRAENAEAIIAGYDVVLDCTDNFPTRYLANDVCVFQNKPNVYGSIFQFDGQMSLFDAQRGPCYRCLYAEPPRPGSAPSCAGGGVLGVLPGIVGSIQAAEAIKWITEAGETLTGRLLLFDALSMSFDEIRLEKNPDCVVCGIHPTVTEPIDYEGFCGVSHFEEPVMVPEIQPRELETVLSRVPAPVLLDVREPWEWRIAHIEGALHIPQRQVSTQLERLDPAREIVVYCHVGVRSASVTEMLIRKGFSHAKNLTGGIRAWTNEIDQELNPY